MKFTTKNRFFMSSMSIPDVLQATQKLKEGIYLFTNGRWTCITKEIQKTPLQVYEDTALKIIEESSKISKLNQTQIKKVHLFIQKFNAAWTTACIAQKVIVAPKNEPVIQFNSYNKYGWLSNFFKTIIFDEKKGRIFPHVEAGYVAFKAENADELSQEERLVFINEAVKIVDPKKSKQKGRGLPRPSDEAALLEMRRLVELKFSQNPILERLLISSSSSELEEFTADAFWGTANGTLYTKDSNQLGKILSAVRALLLQSKKS